MLRLWRYLYGENPLHLLAVLACFALVGYAVSFWYEDPSWWALLIWFVGAVIGHDLVLYPLYALADQPLTIARWARRRVLPTHPPLVPAINHIRVPVLGSAVLGLIYLPTITQHSDDAFTFAAGHPLTDQYQNWLGITGLLFLVSAIIYAFRLGGGVVRRTRRRPLGDDDGRESAPLAAGLPVAAPAESPAVANGHSPAESPAVPNHAEPGVATVDDDDASPSHDTPSGHTEPTVTDSSPAVVDDAPSTDAPEVAEPGAAPTASHTEPEAEPTEHDDAEADPAPGVPVVTNETAPTDDDTTDEPTEEKARPVEDSAGSEQPSG